MPARLAIASIERSWKPCSPTSVFVTSSNCSRRCAALRRVFVTGLTLRRLQICSLRERKLHRRNHEGCALMFRQTDLPSTTGVAIVGSGFSGLAMAVELKRSGREDFVILERAHDVAGTWRDNTYPGCA